MAFAIPKIQYKNLDTLGTTVSGNGTISGIADTTTIEVGMFVRGTGVPSGAKVGSVSTGSIVLASGVLATANGTDIAMAFGYEIAFDFPPKEVTGEILESKNTSSESLSGIKQVAVNYVEATRNLTFSFMSQTIYLLMDTFLKTHALYGNSFRYYDDGSSVSYTEYEVATLKSQPKKIAPKGEDIYVWELPLILRRAL